MHIPDNYLSPATCAVMGAAMVPVWALSVSKIKKEINDRNVPMLGISAAFSFLIMMLNIPLPGGTTGHAVGASLIAILLGPFSACITVSIALLVQALFFGDGGILAFGANCFNMAFIMPFSGYFIFKIMTGVFKSEKSRYIAAFVSGYIALNIAAFFTAVEFGIQPLLFKDATGLPLYAPYPPGISIPAMLIPHLLVAGIAEGIITAGTYLFISRMAPEILHRDKKKGIAPVYILLLALIVITPVGLIATGTAWGEWGLEDLVKMTNFTPSGMRNGFDFKAVMPDYEVPMVNNAVVGYLISAVAGSAILLIIFKFVAEFLKKRLASGKDG